MEEMSYEEDRRALKIHGFEFSDDSSSGEDSKSIDEDYYKWKPSPIPIRRFQNRIVKIKSNSKFEHNSAKNAGKFVQQHVINKQKNKHKKAKNTRGRTYVNSSLSSFEQRPFIKIQSSSNKPVENFKVPTVTKVPKNILINAKHDQQKLLQAIQPHTSFNTEVTHGQPKHKPTENQNLYVAKPSTSTNYGQNQNLVNFVEQRSTHPATDKWIPSTDNPKPAKAFLGNKSTGAIPKRKIETTPSFNQMENIQNSFIFESVKQPQNHQQKFIQLNELQANKSVGQPKLPILHRSISKSSTKNPINSQDQPTVQQTNQNQQQPPPKQLILTNESQANKTQTKSETRQVPVSNQNVSSLASESRPKSVQSKHDDKFKNQRSHRNTQVVTSNVPDVIVQTPISWPTENLLSSTDQPTRTQPTPQERSQSTAGCLSSMCDMFTSCFCFCCT